MRLSVSAETETWRIHVFPATVSYNSVCGYSGFREVTVTKTETETPFFNLCSNNYVNNNTFFLLLAHYGDVRSSCFNDVITLDVHIPKQAHFTILHNTFFISFFLLLVIIIIIIIIINYHYYSYKWNALVLVDPVLTLHQGSEL